MKPVKDLKTLQKKHDEKAFDKADKLIEQINTIIHKDKQKIRDELKVEANDEDTAVEKVKPDNEAIYIKDEAAEELDIGKKVDDGNYETLQLNRTKVEEKSAQAPE